MPAIRPLALILSTLLAPAVAAQSAAGPAMEEALSEAGGARPLLRCTALFRALRLHPASAEGILAGAALRETDLATTAALVWQQETTGAGPQAAFDAIVPMIGAASEVYSTRLTQNVAATGRQFDAALEEDLIYCDALHDGLAPGE